MTMFAANTARITAAVTSTIAAPEEWMATGLCARRTNSGAPVYTIDLWFPAGHSPAETTVPKAICAACPVQVRCAEYAIEKRIPEGIWGGLDDRDRRNLNRNITRRNARAQAKTETAA